MNPDKLRMNPKAVEFVKHFFDAGKPVVVDVEFRGWTPAGELRHAVFNGWHEG